MLRFEYLNHKLSTFVEMPPSSSQYRFNRNAKELWFDPFIESLVSCELPNRKDVAMQWLLSFIGSFYNDDFVNATHNLGLLLSGKKMDAETASAMWEASNINLKQ